MDDRDLDPLSIRPMHSVNNCKMRRLAISFMEEGWTRRRLLVEECERGLFAWTGTHRLAAARFLRLPTVPCRVLTQAEADAALESAGYNRYGYSCWRGALTGAEGKWDRDRLRGLERAGLHDAAAMLREEMEAEEG